MNTPGIIFTLGGLRLTQYGLCIALGLLAGYLMAQYQARAYGIRLSALRRVFLGALIGMAVGARLVYALVNFSFYGQNPGALIRLWEGGYSVMGAMLGGVIGLGASAGRRGFRRALDVMVPALLAVLAIWRLGELATWQGRGLMLDDGAPGFPLTVANSQGRRCLAVCVYEAIAALAIMGYALPRRQGRPAGDVGLMCLALLGLSQVPLESMRNDDFLALGFVKIDQVLAMVMALAVILTFLRGYLRAGRGAPGGYGALAVALAMIGLCVAEEFRLDDSQNPLHNYAMLGLYTCVMAICVQFLRLGWRAAQRSGGSARRESRAMAPGWRNAAPRDPRLSHAYYPAGRDGRTMSYRERLAASERRAAAESGVEHISQRPGAQRDYRRADEDDPRYGTWRNTAGGSQYGAQYKARLNDAEVERRPDRYSSATRSYEARRK